MDCSCLGRATTDKNDQVIADNHALDHPSETRNCSVAKLVEKFDSGDYALNEYINSLSKWIGFKVACSSEFSWSTNLESKLIEFFVFVNF